MEKWNHLYFNKKAPAPLKKGQALLELAIFGAILIMLLGILVNYGLRYNFQQQIMQESFRRALAAGTEAIADGKPSSVSVVVIKDKHIPNPSDRWGMGSVMPFSASTSSVIRNWEMEKTADTESELPRMSLEIQGSKCPGSYLSPAGSNPPCYYLTAGFREESSLPESAIDKYEEIYGSTLQGCAEFNGDGNCVRWVNLTSDGKLNEEVKTECTEESLDFEGNTVCVKFNIGKIRFIDSNAGEIVDYSSAVRQCRQIVDKEVCKTECERGKAPGSDKDCNAVCDSDINTPWYCQGYIETDIVHHKYVFPRLDQLFIQAAGRQSLGVQSDYTQTTKIKENKLTKEESELGITTTDTVDWSDTTKRKVVYKPYKDESGSTVLDEIENSASQTGTKKWQTGW